MSTPESPGFSLTPPVAPICWAEAGGRNTYTNCDFFGGGDAASAVEAGMRSLTIGGAVGENKFVECTIGLDTIERLVAELECEALQSRAARLRTLLAPTEPAANLDRIVALLQEEDGFSEFRRRWERPMLHAVFTAHPTCLLTPGDADAVASAALNEDPRAATVCAVPGPGPGPIGL